MQPRARTLSISPSGRYRVVAEKLDFVTGEELDSEIVLYDNKNNPVLRVALTNQRSMDVIWKKNETGLILNNANANSGDYLVYAQEGRQGRWSVRRHSSNCSSSKIRTPTEVLNPGFKRYPDFRYYINGEGFRGDAIMCLVRLRATRKIEGRYEITETERQYFVPPKNIASFPEPPVLHNLESTLRWD